MRSERVEFFSGGSRLAGIIHWPEQAAEPPPVLVQGPGWLALACFSTTDSTSEPYHRGFAEAGFAVLNFDYRGFGGSEGERGWVKPADQVADIKAALSYVETRHDLDASRIGLFGIGGVGAGNAIIATAEDERVKCVAVQAVVADGAQWMRGMRREYEWVAFRERVLADLRRTVLGEPGEMVDPREELMVASPERKSEGSRATTDKVVGKDFHLATAAHLLAYRPIDVVHRIAPRGLLLTCVEGDVVTPADHARALYRAAGSPKKLIVQRGVRHYESYRRNMHVLLPAFVDWYRRFLVSDAIGVVSSDDSPGTAAETSAVSA
ncbi:hypothetical protein BH23CHL7_BH23CHL7_01850 [soil metagenome]